MSDTATPIVLGDRTIHHVLRLGGEVVGFAVATS
jgi:hypothetical protein